VGLVVAENGTPFFPHLYSAGQPSRGTFVPHPLIIELYCTNESEREPCHTSHDVRPASKELVTFTYHSSSGCIKKDWKVPGQLAYPH